MSGSIEKVDEKSDGVRAASPVAALDDTPGLPARGALGHTLLGSSALPVHVHADDHSPPGRPVVFEDYLHYAVLQRELENQDGRNVDYPEFHDGSGKGMYPDREKVLSDLEVERIQARRALRVATWWSVFFLVR